jgi:hypothetical protein
MSAPWGGLLVADIDIDRAAMEAVLYRVRRDELEDASARLNERGQANSPVDKGNLRRSHKVLPVNADATEAGVEATADYAAAVHEGHRLVAWGRDTGRFVPPNPWLRRSVDELASENQ